VMEIDEWFITTMIILIADFSIEILADFCLQAL
jgi:hypothetical protein